MDEIQKVLTANLIESLRQIQQYLVLALGASLSAVALLFAPAPRSDSGEGVSLPILSVPVPRAAAHLLLWVFCLVGGFMAGNTAHLSYLIAVKLAPVPGLLAAFQTFPCVATSPPLLVKAGMIYLPPLLSGFAVCWQLRREKAPATAMITILVVLLGAWLQLWMQMPQLTNLIGTPQ